jgi:Tetratricopeptide repeat
MVFRKLKRPALAESHFRSAMELAAGAGCPLSEADAARELAGLYQDTGRSGDALALLQRARSLYERLQARSDVAGIDEEIAAGSHQRGAHA